MIVRIPPSDGKEAVSAVATPSMTRETTASTCSRMKTMTRITPTARKPGISRMVCSRPMSAPSNAAISTTKLLSSADHVAKATGMMKANSISSASGRCQRGREEASARGNVRMTPAIGPVRTAVHRAASRRMVYQETKGALPAWSALSTRSATARARSAREICVEAGLSNVRR